MQILVFFFKKITILMYGWINMHKKFEFLNNYTENFLCDEFLILHKFTVNMHSKIAV